MEAKRRPLVFSAAIGDASVAPDLDELDTEEQKLNRRARDLVLVILEAEQRLADVEGRERDEVQREHRATLAVLATEKLSVDERIDALVDELAQLADRYRAIAREMFVCGGAGINRNFGSLWRINSSIGHRLGFVTLPRHLRGRLADLERKGLQQMIDAAAADEAADQAPDESEAAA